VEAAKLKAVAAAQRRHAAASNDAAVTVTDIRAARGAGVNQYAGRGGVQCRHQRQHYNARGLKRESACLLLYIWTI
jgi:hypothetical protein